ncbi:Psbp domain protein [Thalictrum thalictroides]|uniref:Psbp domain protein n=1 Tax=Thalictrum thalictroides TaxID=46969 RepID=A0A7J6W4I1_THATH|nr:Psbp domain protein [Thalictrum thalictroides]
MMMRAGEGGLVLSSTNLKRSTSILHSTRKLNKQFTVSTTLLSTALSESLQFQATKRKFSLSLLLGLSNTAISLLFSTPSPALNVQDEQLDLKRYTDDKQGFTLLIPSSWIKVEKAGATVLFEEMNKGINNVGVVVSPVRLNSLADFGTPQFVADKLIQAEKRKESTKDAEVIGVAERSGHGGVQVYEFEYMLDSTRGGLKRIFSAAFVAAKKLYLLNIAYSDKPENPLDSSTKMMLEQVLHSFDTPSSI